MTEATSDWIFAAPAGGPLSESTGKRSVARLSATEASGHLIEQNLWDAADRTEGTWGPWE